MCHRCIVEGSNREVRRLPAKRNSRVLSSFPFICVVTWHLAAAAAPGGVGGGFPIVDLPVDDVDLAESLGSSSSRRQGRVGQDRRGHRPGRQGRLLVKVGSGRHLVIQFGVASRPRPSSSTKGFKGAPPQGETQSNLSVVAALPGCASGFRVASFSSSMLQGDR